MSSSPRALPLFLFSTALAVMAAIQPKPAKADTVPSYFLSKWTVDRDCTEVHAGTKYGHTIPGLQIQVKSEADGSYTLVPADNAVGRWSRGWKGVKARVPRRHADGCDSRGYGMRPRPGSVLAVPRAIRLRGERRTVLSVRALVRPGHDSRRKASPADFPAERAAGSGVRRASC